MFFVLLLHLSYCTEVEAAKHDIYESLVGVYWLAVSSESTSLEKLCRQAFRAGKHKYISLTKKIFKCIQQQPDYWGFCGSSSDTGNEQTLIGEEG